MESTYKKLSHQSKKIGYSFTWPPWRSFWVITQWRCRWRNWRGAIVWSKQYPGKQEYAFYKWVLTTSRHSCGYIRFRWWWPSHRQYRRKTRPSVHFDVLWWRSWRPQPQEKTRSSQDKKKQSKQKAWITNSIWSFFPWCPNPLNRQNMQGAKLE